MFTALTSLLTNRTVRSDTAMTARSRCALVLPVGGIKEKVVAAAAAGLKRVMLPARNKRDYDDIPKSARDNLEFIWLERVDEAIAAALRAGRAKSTQKSKRRSDAMKKLLKQAKGSRKTQRLRQCSIARSTGFAMRSRRPGGSFNPFRSG